MYWIYLLCVFVLDILSHVHAGKPVYVSNGTHILSYSRDSPDVLPILGQTGFKIIGLTIDIGNDRMFWSDNSAEHRGIYAADVYGRNVTCIVKDVDEVVGLTVDWVSRHLYWTDLQRRTVDISNYDGSGRRVLVSKNLRSPRSIVADPIYGFLFWSDQKARRIERAWLDGSHRRTIIKSADYWPNQLAVSHQSKQLYWVDSKAYAIFSSDLSGKKIKEQVNYSKITGGALGYGLIVFGNTAVVSTWFTTAIFSMLLGARRPIWQLEAKSLGTRELFSLVSLNPSTQPMTLHRCMEEDNGGCSHLCLPLHKNEFKCSCPTYGGLALSSDNKTCQVPADILLTTFEDSGDIGFISLDNQLTGAMTMVSSSTKPSAITYDTSNKMIYWSDVTDHAIYRVRLDGTDRSIFLNASDGIDTVTCLAFNPVTGMLYYSNMGQPDSTVGSMYFTKLGLKGSSADQLTYGWARIEGINVHTMTRNTITENVKNPVELLLDVKQRYLYVSDIGESVRLVRMELDGQNPVEVQIPEISQPVGLALDGDNLILGAIHTKRKRPALRIIKYNREKSTSEENIIKDTTAKSLTAHGDKVYFIDKASRLILQVNGTETVVVTSSTGAADIHYVSTSHVEFIDHQLACKDFGCSHDCVPLPREHENQYRCICPDEHFWVLANDSRTCQRPENFLLYADMTTLGLISLDKDTSTQTQTLYYGGINTNFVSVLYDRVKDRIFWTDHSSNALYVSSVEKFDPVLVYKDVGVIGDLVMDREKQRLYWTGTAWPSDRGYIASISIEKGLDSYKKLLVDLDSPRALALHPDGRTLFWSESQEGGLGAEIHSCKTNGRRHRAIITAGINWPNAIVATKDRLYIAESSQRIISTNLNGNKPEELLSTSGHIYNLAVLGDHLFFSDWQDSLIQVVDMATNTSTTLIANITRPTALALEHPRELSDNCLEGPCTDVCEPQIRGGYVCYCHDNRIMLEDAVTCENVTTTTSTTTTTTTAPPTTTLMKTTKNVPTSTTSRKELIGKHYGEPKPSFSTSKQTIDDTTTSSTTVAIETKNHPKMDPYDMYKSNPFKLPYFEDCPSHETIISYIPADGNTALVPVNPVGYEGTGRRLPLTCNYEIQDGGLSIMWEGDEVESIHHVVYKITDDWANTAICEFKVALQDVDTPKFTFCPTGIDISTAAPQVQAHWRVPEATDNVRVKHMTGTHVSGDMFVPGLTRVSYMATDIAGNQATCSFPVIVKQDLPYFKNCPFNETIVEQVPEMDMKVVLPIKPEAYDYNGTSLALHCNYELRDEGLMIPWLGQEEQESIHHVIYKVTDSNLHMAVCEFVVKLQDVHPPRFTYCPGTIKVRSSSESQGVNWTHPEAVDNVHVREVIGSHPVGSVFPPGENKVNYTAIDQAGNQAYCIFSVIVLQDGLCALPDIGHGGVVCNHGDKSDGECQIICETGFVVNPIRIFRRLFNCKHPDDIDSLNKVMTSQKPCLSRQYPSVMQQEFSLQLHGPINRHRPEVLSFLSLKISSHLEHKNLCRSDVCQIGNISLPCHTVADIDHPEADVNGSLPCLDDEEEMDFKISFNITLKNSTEEEVIDVSRIIQDIHLELMSLAAMLQLQLDEHQIVAVSDSLVSTKAQWSCPMGQISENHICIACPAGTFHNLTVDICQYCGLGRYQSHEGQVACDACGSHQTSPDGSTSVNMCHTVPSMDEMTLFIIVTACSFGVVFLCMAITLYLQFQRQQKRNQQVNQKKTRYNMSPNIYVAPPPILKSKLDDNLSPGQRTYSIDKKHPINIFMNHDYEDMGDNSNSNQGPPLSTAFSNNTYNTQQHSSASLQGSRVNMYREYSPANEVPTGTLSRENTFNNSTYSPLFGVKRNGEAGSLKGTLPSRQNSPGPSRKMSYDSTFSNTSPRMMRANRTPTSDTPLITQSPLLRLKLAAYNLNHED